MLSDNLPPPFSHRRVRAVRWPDRNKLRDRDRRRYRGEAAAPLGKGRPYSAGEECGDGPFPLSGSERDLVGHAVAVAVPNTHLEVLEGRCLEGRYELLPLFSRVGEKHLD